jgi:hypothetical protein
MSLDVRFIFTDIHQLIAERILAPPRKGSELNRKKIFSPYRAVNTLRLSYTNQSVNAVQ